MKSVALIVFLCVVGIISATALAEPSDNPKVQSTKQLVQQVKKERANNKATKLPPLKLPDIQAMSKAAWKADRPTLQRQLVASRNVIRFWNNKGSWIRAPRQEKCWDVPWQRSCTIARASLRLHTTLAKIAETRLTRELPLTNDWRTAVRLTQRVWPGTESWLLFISNREGGYGPFVMNHQGSGAGGWMQFMASTFYGYVDDARLALEAKGFLAPPGVWVWTNPMGQALTAGYMRFTGRDGCHWCL